MQYKLVGFNQLEAIKLGLSTDDLIVLQWFLEFKNKSKIEKNYIAEVNDMGYWVSYSTIINDLPIILTDGTKYLEEYVELQKNKSVLNEKEFDALEKKIMEKNKKKIQRILSGNLSKVLKRDIRRLGTDKGSKVYLYLDTEVYDKLVDAKNNIDTYLREKGVENVDKFKSRDKSVHYAKDKIVHHRKDKSVHHTEDKNVHSDPVNNDSVNNDPVYNTTVVPVTNINKELIEKNTHLKIDSPNQKNTIVSWEKERLIKAIEIFNAEDGKYFKLLNKIYNDDRNFIDKKEAPHSGANNPNKSICKNYSDIPKVKTRFHNFKETFRKYTPEELEEVLLESQKKKFG